MIIRNKDHFTLTAKDLDIEWFSGSGKGGQHKNKHPNCCRIRHRESGVTVVGQDHKERPRNQKDALKRLSEHYKFKAWCQDKLIELRDGATLEEKVDAMLTDDNIKYEVKRGGKWVEVDSSEII